MWNELVKDGEIVTDAGDGLINSAGVVAKKSGESYGVPTRPRKTFIR